jgi:hypothetical protein
MSKLDKMSGFRGGALYSAANVAPTTARTWPISFGKKGPGDGHNRYDAHDVVALTLMRDLALEIGFGPTFAAAIVNCIRPTLETTTVSLLEEQAAMGEWRWGGGPYVMITPRRGVAVGEWLQVVEEGDIASFLAEGGRGGVFTVINLPTLINKSMYQLELVLSGEKPELSDI